MQVRLLCKGHVVFSALSAPSPPPTPTPLTHTTTTTTRPLQPQGHFCR